MVEVWCDLSLTTNSQQLIIAFWRRSCKQARVGCVLLLCLLTFHCRSVVGVASNMIWPVCCLGQGRELPADHTLYAKVPAPHTLRPLRGCIINGVISRGSWLRNESGQPWTAAVNDDRAQYALHALWAVVNHCYCDCASSVSNWIPVFIRPNLVRSKEIG